MCAAPASDVIVGSTDSEIDDGIEGESVDTLVIPFELWGNSGEYFDSQAPEIVLVGAAGTGKSRTALEKLHYLAATHPDVRILMVRKTYTSLKGSGMVTFDEEVRPELDGVVFVGETARRPPHYQYPTGSVIVVGGMDRPTKVLSTPYDVIYVQEATELELDDWEVLTTRLRNGKLPFQQLMADCNPDRPTHWLKLRADAGKVEMLTSRHEDNPRLYDHDAHAWTAEGTRYLSVLDALTGVRLARFRFGVWAAAEGMIYADSWSDALNLLDPREIPHSWPRYLAIDFGHTHPFVCQWWAEDDDGRFYLYRELYVTRWLVEDAARAIRQASGWGGDDCSRPTERPGSDPLPAAIYCDHDAEGRATLERHLGVRTRAANKAVKAGIDLVKARMRPATDGRPRLFVLRDCLALGRRDPELVKEKLPTCTVEELPGYVWDLQHAAAAAKEQPIKKDDHGLDCMRYLVASRDSVRQGITYGPQLYTGRLIT